MPNMFKNPQKAASRFYTGVETPVRREFIHRGLVGPDNQLRRASTAPVEFSRQSALRRTAKENKNEAKKDLMLDVLSATSTKREAKSYLSRFKARQGAQDAFIRPRVTARKDAGVNLGSLFPLARAIEESPTFIRKSSPSTIQDPKEAPLRTALVVIKDSSAQIDQLTLRDIGLTLSQLSVLGMVPIIVVDEEGSIQSSGSGPDSYRPVLRSADRIVSAIEESGSQRSRRLDGIFTLEEAPVDTIRPTCFQGQVKVDKRAFLFKPLIEGTIPVVVPLAFDPRTQKIERISTHESVMALVRDIAGIHRSQPDESGLQTDSQQKAVSLDRLIIIDALGGIPSTMRSSKSHIFVNLEQEFEEIEDELENMTPHLPENDQKSHKANLRIARDALAHLPPSSSAFIISPQSATNSRKVQKSSAPEVGTRSRRNPLIHNLLTDKPAMSASLPSSRLAKVHKSDTCLEKPQPATFLKRGMPVTIFPDPKQMAWVPPTTTNSIFSIKDPRLDLPRLINLIEDSFGRPLDAKAYFDRVAPRLAGIIIAGAYEGGAILTWEDPSTFDSDKSQKTAGSSGLEISEPQRLVPYLDKFAVLTRLQGAGGVADIVFNAMVRDCFPNGVCWRSRTANPVNKWYFERAKGSYKLPARAGSQSWTMFWTTEGLNAERFHDYESVCKGIGTSWADGKKTLD